jgi:hypothetical protein
MFSMIEIGPPCNQETDCRFGGSPHLPDDIDWPVDSENVPLLHLFTISSVALNHYMNLAIEDGLQLSVFVPFKAGDIKRGISLARDPYRSKVLLYKPLKTHGPKNSEQTLEPRTMTFMKDRPDDEDEEEFSGEVDDKIGGGPIWLQRRIQLPESRFLLQINEGLLTKVWPELAGIFVGGMGFLFVKNPARPGRDSIGELRVQFT